MNTIDNCINLALAKPEIKTQTMLAKKLGIGQGYLSKIRSGKELPSDAVLIAIAEIAGVDSIVVIADYKIETAKLKEVKRFWEKVRRVAASVVFFTVSTTIASMTSGLIGTSEAASHNVYYVK